MIDHVLKCKAFVVLQVEWCDGRWEKEERRKKKMLDVRGVYIPVDKAGE